MANSEGVIVREALRTKAEVEFSSVAIVVLLGILCHLGGDCSPALAPGASVVEANARVLARRIDT